jgi:hypothetical protein
MTEKYNQYLQGSDTDPGPGCDAPEAADTQRDLDVAREADRLMKVANDLADHSQRK